MARGADTHNAGRDEKRKFPSQTPWNGERQSEPLHEGPRTMEAVRLNGDEERRRKILDALQKGQPYKNLARGILDSKGQYSEQQVNSVVKHIYGIDFNQPHFIFKDKMPGRMLDSTKWKRTDVDHIVDGRSYSYQAKEPKMISHRTHNIEKGTASNNIETSQQGTASNSCDRGKQVITRPSKEKYGFWPQFHEELSSSMPGFFGNSEDIEDFLVGGKEKFQEIRRELGAHSGGISSGETHEKDIGSFGETHEKDVDGSVISSDHSPLHKRKLFTLWDVDIYEDDFHNSTQDVETSKRKSGSAYEQDVNHSD
jgi:hypothetical protein